MRSLFPAPLQKMWFGVPCPPIQLPFGKAEAEKRLKQKAPGWWSGFGQAGLRGSVRDGKLTLAWNTPGFRNSWRPVLHGRLMGDDRISRIEGVFSSFRVTQIFNVVWFGGLVAFVLLSLVLSIVSLTKTGILLFAMGCFLMMALGVGMVAFGQYLSRNEQEKIIAALREL